MAAPTQELPPWLSYSTTVLTNAAGTPIATSSSLVYLPLTYYGPSIPLGTLFTYGGLSSPESSLPTLSSQATPTMTPPLSPSPPFSPPAIPPSTIGTTFFTPIPSSISAPLPSPSVTSPSATVIPSPTAVTTTSSPVASPSSVPISTASTASLPLTTMSISAMSISAMSLSSTTMTRSLSPAPTASSTISASPMPASFSNMNRNVIVAIVLGAILGSVFLLLLVLLCLRWRVRRGRNQNASEFGFATPLWANWMIVTATRDRLRRMRRRRNRPSVEGDPRESGDEIDPFLTHRASAHSESPEGDPVPGPSVRMVPPESPVGRSRRSRGTGAAEDDDDSSGSGYGTLLERFPSTTGRPYGHIMQPEDLLRLDAEPEHNGGGGARSYSPLVPPPRPDPDRTVGLVQPTFSAQRASNRSFTSDFMDTGEAGTLLTARRVRVQDMGLRPSTHASTSPPPDPSSSRRFPTSLGIGLGALVGFRRRSWFGNNESPSRPTSYIAHALSDTQLEAGKALLGDESGTLAPGELGVGPDGTRPISGFSARSGMSGNSLYFDAPSSLRGTPELTPLPRALTPSSPHGSGHQSRPSSGVGLPTDPPPYEHEPHLLDTHSPTQTNLNLAFPPEMDILDIPAPPPASPFGSASPWGSSSSSRGSMGNLPFSPNLALLTTPRQWQNLSDSSASYRVSASNSDRVTIDVLEEEPPAAAERWRSIAGVTEGPRRSTFGSPQVVHQNDPTTSQQGSLHSMRQHLSPQSSGSVSQRLPPASDGSASSRPSGHSVMRSINSRGSFAQGSVASDGRRWPRNSGAQSPAVSAFGGVRPMNEHGYLSPYPSPPRSPVTMRPPTSPATVADPVSATGVSETRIEAGTVNEAATTCVAEPESPVTGLGNVPWASGLDTDWNAK